jgi:uncharacterized protein with HEPN domain
MQPLYNIDIIRHTAKLCAYALETWELLGATREALESSAAYRRIAAINAYQIALFTARLTDDFTARFNGVPWDTIAGMRYTSDPRGDVDARYLYAIMTDDVPALHRYCQELIYKYNVMVQKALTAMAESRQP